MESQRKRRGSQRIFTCGPCYICRTPFISANSNGVIGKYCSQRCEKQATRASARARGIPKTKIRGVPGRTLKALLDAPCAYCGAVSAHIDHILPRSKGGPDAEWNLIGACAECNVRKRDRSLVTFIAEKPDRLAYFLAS